MKSQPNGWDERDYKLWSYIRTLPSYGLIGSNDYMISLKAVEQLLEQQAKERYDTTKNVHYSGERTGL